MDSSEAALHRDPRASIGAGVETDGALDLCSRLAARFWDLDDQVRVVLHPEAVHRYAY